MNNIDKVNDKKNENDSELSEFDEKHVWHPYTSLSSPIPTYHVVSADKCLVGLLSRLQSSTSY